MVNICHGGYFGLLLVVSKISDLITSLSIQHEIKRTMLEKNIDSISEAEAALYDRQIRLWGLDAQKRLRTARILLIGIGGLGSEVAKNVILSGVKSVTLLDHRNITEDDRCNQFLVDHSDIGKNRSVSSLERAQQLNPMVRVEVCENNVDTLPNEYFYDYDVICVTQCGHSTLIRINDVCRFKNIIFYAGDVWGFYGYMFADLGDHDYAEDIPVAEKNKLDEKANALETTTIKKTIKYTSLSDALNTNWNEATKQKIKRTPNTYFIVQILIAYIEKYKDVPKSVTAQTDYKILSELRTNILNKLNVTHDVVPEDFANYCISEISPVSAIVGGILAQEIIKSVSKKDTPHNNFFFYNGIDGSGMVDYISK